MLADGAGSSQVAACVVVGECLVECVPVEAVVGGELLVFGGDRGEGHFGGDLVVGNPAVLVGLFVLNHGLEHEAGGGQGQPAPGKDEEKAEEEEGDRQADEGQQEATEGEIGKAAGFAVDHGGLGKVVLKFSYDSRFVSFVIRMVS